MSELDLLVPDLVAVDGDRGLELDVELGLAGLEFDVLRVFVGAFHALLGLELGEHGQVLHEVAVGLHVLGDAADFTQLGHQMDHLCLLGALLLVADDLLIDEQGLVRLEYLHLVGFLEVLDVSHVLAVLQKRGRRLLLEVDVVNLVKAVVPVVRNH